MASSSRLWPIIALVMTLVSLILLVVLMCLFFKNDSGDMPTCGDDSSDQNEYFGIVDDNEPQKPGPFHDLTSHELRKIRAFIESDPQFNVSQLNDDMILDKNALLQGYISVMDLYPPRKHEALAYIDKGHSQPPREALVILFRGDKTPPVVEERICGPLPSITSCRMLESEKRRNPVEFSLRPFNMLEMKTLTEVMLQGVVEEKIGFILRESFGISYANCDVGPCLNFFTSPVGTNLLADITKRRMWVMAQYPVEYYFLHPVDFGIVAVMDSADPNDYRMDKVWYAGRLYKDMDELVIKYNNGSIPNIRRKMPEDNEDVFSSIYLRGEPTPGTSRRPPQIVEPDGKRYTVKQRKVEYLGWQFNFRMSTLFGPQLFDIRFKGDRIAYEIALNELAVFYSAHNPMQQVADFSDSTSYMGTMTKSMVLGVDCPHTATLISNTIAGQMKKGPVTFPNTWCLFEANNGVPLRRHMGYAQVHGSFYGGMPDAYLVLRSIITVGNYDYIVDFSFHQNGVMDTRVTSTGYLMVSPYSDKESPYGFKIHEHILGTLHHHLFHFKVDMDVGGSTDNRYTTLNIRPTTATLTMNQTKPYYQTSIISTLKQTELEGLYKYNFDKPAYHIVHNEKKKTRFGEIRGYSLVLGGMSKQLLRKFKNNERTFPWARHQLAVTEYSDDERTSSSSYAMFDSQDPVVDFTKYYSDNSNIVDKDLVFWVSMGLHHIPRSEDIPLTATTGTHLTFSIAPFNQYSECPSMASRDAVRLRLKDPDKPSKGVKLHRYNGNTEKSCTLPKPSYDQLIEQLPSSALETEFKGVL